MTVKINRGEVAGGINMTPMIDCVFLLLIFFLVASKFEEEERQMNISLPQASEAVPKTIRPKELIVNVTQEGHYYVAGQRLDLTGLFAALQQSWANNPGRASVIIRADRRCVWQFVVNVMNQCNKANIRNYQVSAMDPPS